MARAGDTVVGGVRIVGLQLQTAGVLHVMISSLSPSAAAARTEAVALGDLLRGQEIAHAQSAHCVRFDLLSGGEGPAGTTGTLIIRENKPPLQEATAKY